MKWIFRNPEGGDRSDKPATRDSAAASVERTTLESLLGTYVGLKHLGITIMWAADHGLRRNWFRGGRRAQGLEVAPALPGREFALDVPIRSRMSDCGN